MPACAIKRGEKIRLLLVVLICFSILFIELTFLAVWSTDEDSSDESSEIITAGHVELMKTIENGLIKKRDDLKPLLANSSKETRIGSKKIADKSLQSEDVDLRIQEVFAPFVDDSLGRILNVEFKSIGRKLDNDSKHTLDIVYRKPKHRVLVLEVKRKTVPKLSARRYVYVYERYWEQLTMNTRVLMALASQAKIAGRFVVEPKVKDSVFGTTGHPFSTYFNVTDVNHVLTSNGYSTLVDQDEFDSECSPANNVHAVLYFLYKDNKAVSLLKDRFGITTRQYDEINERAKKNGWTDCEILRLFLSRNSKTFCVDPTVVTQWDVLEKGILRDIKCLVIFVWRGLGVKTRTSFSENHVKVSSQEIHFLLKPSRLILNEAELFTKTYLSGGYIAVQIRGEKVVIQHDFTRLKKCLRLLVNVIENTKKFFGVSKVFVATDMSDFGSGSWAGTLKNNHIYVHTLQSIHSTLISRIGGIVYKPSADWQTPDRGAVSLVELSIIAHAQHLLTIGTGSYQGWAVGKFLEFHRNSNQWSLTRLCSLPR